MMLFRGKSDSSTGISDYETFEAVTTETVQFTTTTITADGRFFAMFE
jgi:hypothetical protein